MKKQLTTALLALVCYCTFPLNPTNAQIIWQKCYGGNSDEFAYSNIKTLDHGYIMAGLTASNDSIITDYNGGGTDFFIVKTDSMGNVAWKKCFGGSNSEGAFSIIQNTDSSYVVTGYTGSNDSDVVGNHGGTDMWLIKLDPQGNLLWQKCLGGSQTDLDGTVISTYDNGYFVIGTSMSSDGDVTLNYGNQDFWVVKMDSAANLLWQKNFGGSGTDIPKSVVQAQDSGYVIMGWTNSHDSDVVGNNSQALDYDFWLIKLDKSGNLLWQRCLGGSNNDQPYGFLETSDQGYLITGFTASNDSDVTGNHGYNDYWIVKLDSARNIEWQKCLGGTSNDRVSSVLENTNDSTYIVFGGSGSVNGDVTGNHGGIDYWLTKIDRQGNLLAQKCFGGTDFEIPASLIQESPNIYVLGGHTKSTNGDVSGKHGGYDFWLVKVDISNLTNIANTWSKSLVRVYPNPTQGEVQLQLDKTPSKNCEFSMVSLSGKEIFRQKITSEKERFFIPTDSPGIYIGTVSDDKQIIQRTKIVFLK